MQFPSTLLGFMKQFYVSKLCTYRSRQHCCFCHGRHMRPQHRNTQYTHTQTHAHNHGRHICWFTDRRQWPHIIHILTNYFMINKYHRKSTVSAPFVAARNICVLRFQLNGKITKCECEQWREKYREK